MCPAVLGFKFAACPQKPYMNRKLISREISGLATEISVIVIATGKISGFLKPNISSTASFVVKRLTLDTGQECECKANLHGGFFV